MWDMCVIRAGDRMDADPLALVMQHLVTEDAPLGEFISAEALAFSRELDSTLVWVDELSQGEYAPWHSFLQRYARACGDSGRYEFGRFCLIVSGENAAISPANETHISVKRLDGYVSELDVLLYASYADSASFREGRLIDRAFRSAVIRLATNDLDVCDRLLTERFQDSESASEVLEAIAAERGWTSQIIKDCTDPLERWSRGIEVTIDGRRQLNAAALTAIDHSTCIRELGRRIWAGQVSVIMPHLEELRRDVIDDFPDRFTLPHRTDDGREICSIQFLELGHMCFQISQRQATLDRETVKRLMAGREARNQLAHLIPLSFEDRFFADLDLTIR